MAARGVGIFTIEFPDPTTIDYYNDEFVTLGTNISFQYPITSNIQTLSTKNVQRGNDPYGILYVPELRTDGCRQSEEDKGGVPPNATRLSDLPLDTNYALVAIAPWYSPTCMIEYFESARTSPVKAFIVYQPGVSANMPPPMNDPSWGLGDGGEWKSLNNFPTYAIFSTAGTIIMDKLSKYSGNISDAPNSKELESLFQPTDYVRLWATINTATGNQLPSLWVFLVIVLGLLIGAIVLTSGSMHYMQRKRRNDLRRRIVNGEVDLEALGVKRLTVPQEFLEKLPLYTYTTGPSADSAEKTEVQQPAKVHNIPSPTIDTSTGTKTFSLNRRSSAPTATVPPPLSAHQPAWSQPTCVVCLDDYEPNETQVRELPCRHIFHPDCIDTFLLNNSSLCPICKKSVLPNGYCPAKITNVMVRRERMIRRMRERTAANGEVVPLPPPPPPPHDANPAPTRNRPGGFGSLGSRIGGAMSARRIFSAPERAHSRLPDIEMATPANQTTTAATQPVADTQSVSADCPEPVRENRREWARQRALTLLGNHRASTEGQDETTAGPRWKRGLQKVFPGFR